LGPYPSGAPAIFADQVAKLGLGSVLFSCVGNDAFGEMNIARLESDGVNVNGIAILQKGDHRQRLCELPQPGAARFYF
jgi:sugar/nucleoside kinase (ribokinase family)